MSPAMQPDDDDDPAAAADDDDDDDKRRQQVFPEGQIPPPFSASQYSRLLEATTRLASVKKNNPRPNEAIFGRSFVFWS